MFPQFLFNNTSYNFNFVQGGTVWSISDMKILSMHTKNPILYTALLSLYEQTHLYVRQTLNRSMRDKLSIVVCISDPYVNMNPHAQKQKILIAFVFWKRDLNIRSRKSLYYISFFSTYRSIKKQSCISPASFCIYYISFFSTYRSTKKQSCIIPFLLYLFIYFVPFSCSSLLYHYIVLLFTTYSLYINFITPPFHLRTDIKLLLLRQLCFQSHVVNIAADKGLRVETFCYNKCFFMLR